LESIERVMTGFGEDGLEVDGGSVKDILDIAVEF
jgi:hypothetical protein